MNESIKQRWLARLRSGQHGQAKRFLHPRPGLFDVLGVLVDLYIQEKGLSWEIRKAGRQVYTFHGIECVLPPEVRRWAGLEHDEVHQLIHLNDNGCDFSQLADFIERTIAGDDDEPSTPGTGPQMGPSTVHSTDRTESVERGVPSMR